MYLEKLSLVELDRVFKYVYGKHVEILSIEPEYREKVVGDTKKFVGYTITAQRLRNEKIGGLKEFTVHMNDFGFIDHSAKNEKEKVNTRNLYYYAMCEALRNKGDMDSLEDYKTEAENHVKENTFEY